jgi:RNA polymerase sigma factor, sigma-70 family
MKKVIVREKGDVESVIEQYTDTIFKIAYSYTKSREVAEDVMQNVFINYMTSDYTFNDNEHQKAWFIRVTINECKKYFRSLKYQWEKPSIEVFEPNEKHDMYYAVMGLPQKYKIVIHLYYYEQFSIKEISGILQKKENTIMSLLHRARQRLRKIMEEDYEY